MRVSGTNSRGMVLWPLNHNDSSKYQHPVFDRAVLKSGKDRYLRLIEPEIQFSYMFVRDPFDRAISAYFDKVLGGPLLNKSMTLEDFFRYLNHGNVNNHHFLSQMWICNPCRRKLSFLGRTETHNADMDYIINNATDLHEYISYHGNQTIRNKSNWDSEKLATLTLDSVINFVWTYRHDYLAFGYNPYDAIKLVSSRIVANSQSQI